jgi:flagellar L-ring protein precursor FlgH
MKAFPARLCLIAVLFAIAIVAQGCAVLPFAPLIAHALPRMIWPNHQPGQPSSDTASEADSGQIESAVTAASSSAGDSGVGIDAQERVTFMPNAPGSIPLRVAAADLVSDVKARSIGDIVTVKVVESVTGESKAQTDLSSQRSMSGGVSNIVGLTQWLSKISPSVNLGSIVDSSTTNSTTGKGDMTATDKFIATIAAVVTTVNPSGTLSIKGERKLRINGEDDVIHMSGVVRPQDIDSFDQIGSSQVADLDVSISGRGQVRDKQGNGLGTRLFDWLWLF